MFITEPSASKAFICIPITCGSYLHAGSDSGGLGSGLGFFIFNKLSDDIVADTSVSVIRNIGTQ